MSDIDISAWAEESLAQLASLTPVHSIERAELLAAGVNERRVNALYGKPLEDQVRALASLAMQDEALEFFSDEAFNETSLWTMIEKLPDSFYSVTLSVNEDLTDVAEEGMPEITLAKGEPSMQQEARLRNAAGDLADMISMLDALRYYPFTGASWISQDRERFHQEFPDFQGAVAKVINWLRAC